MKNFARAISDGTYYKEKSHEKIKIKDFKQQSLREMKSNTLHTRVSIKLISLSKPNILIFIEKI
jgi:hypothetical protein